MRRGEKGRAKRVNIRKALLGEKGLSRASTTRQIAKEVQGACCWLNCSSTSKPQQYLNTRMKKDQVVPAGVLAGDDAETLLQVIERVSW